MKKAVGISNKPWVIPALIGFVLGTLFGLFALGWGLFPVTWVDASPGQLNLGYQEDYLRAAIDSYGRNQDILAAQQRYQALGDRGPDLLTTITNNPQKQNSEDIAKFSSVTIGKSIAPSSTTTAPDSPDTEKTTLITMLAGLCLLMLVIGGALIYLLFLRNRKGRQKVEVEDEPAQGFVYEQPLETESTSVSHEPEPFSPATPVFSEVEPTLEKPSASGSPPVAQFMTSYNLGDDLYDDTFSIDAPSGEFLGECGSGISDTIGVGDPKKISAFEVWLFDKNDIQTVTKVIMSSHVFSDPNAKQRLSIRGEPVLAEPGKIVHLETATLRMDVRVVDMNYGQSSLPASSFFDRISLELSIHQK